MGTDLGRLVRARRDELGLSRKELAERADVSYPYVSQIETGDREPSLRTLQKVAAALELPVESLAAAIAPEDWLQVGSPTGPPEVTSRPPRTGAGPADDQEVLRVSMAVERRLAVLPPAQQLGVLAELTARAARALAEGVHRTRPGPGSR